MRSCRPVRQALPCPSRRWPEMAGLSPRSAYIRPSLSSGCACRRIDVSISPACISSWLDVTSPADRRACAQSGEPKHLRPVCSPLWRCTSDTADTVPVLVRLLDGYPYLPMFAPVHSVVVECLGHIGASAEPTAPILIRYLEADQRRDPISWDQHGQLLAAAALSRIRPPDPKTQALTPPQDQAH
jgi:hypothetical protein